MKRPMPPTGIGEIVDECPITFIPAYDIPDWVREIFMSPDSKLYNPDHFHLYDALDGQIGFLWAASGYESKGRVIIGQT